uniref:Prostacyclin receptor n=1 Tax=Panthera tigris altaica TaxID=74533 RepID=A0A8C9KLN4_PANTA
MCLAHIHTEPGLDPRFQGLLPPPPPGWGVHRCFLMPSLCPQVRGFTQAIAPDSSEVGDLLAFRFNAFNPILDPWVFILFRKAVFQRLRTWLCCLCPRPAHGDSQTPLSRPASGRKDSRAPTALGGKEERWVPLSAWGEGRGGRLPQAQRSASTTGTSSKEGSAAACSLC